MSYPDEKFKQILNALIEPLVAGFTKAFETCEKVRNKSTEISAQSRHIEYPTTKAVFDFSEKLKSEAGQTYEKILNRDTEINADSTDESYPTSKATYEAFQKAVETAVEISGSVTVDGADFATVSPNLFDKNSSEITDDFYISTLGVVTKDTSRRHFITHPIAIQNGKNYTTLWNGFRLGITPKLWLYADINSDASDHISSVTSQSLETTDEWLPVTFTIDNENAKFARLNSFETQKSNLMFIEGSAYLGEYQEYGTYLNEGLKIPQLKDYIPSAEVSDYIPYDDITELQENVIRLENGTIFPEWEIGRISQSTGSDIAVTNGIRTVGYIELQEYGELNVIGSSLVVYLIEYDENKNILSHTYGNDKVLTPTNENCKYVRMYTYESGANLTDTSSHSENVTVYYDEASIEYLVANAKEMREKIENNNIRYSYAFDNILLKSINHRGYNTVAPENTLPAYRLSKRNGFKFVECDIGLTSDKVPVLLHDDTINRTARNADGSEITETININNITYEEALRYDFGIWKSEIYAGTKIPTFEEFIILCRDLGLYPYIELKSTNTYEQNDIDNIERIVAKYGLERSSTYISNSRDVLEMVVKSNKTARVGVLLAGNITDSFCNSTKKMLDTGVNEVFFDILVTYATEANINIYEHNALPVEVYCPNTEEAILTLDKRISGVTSDKLVAEEVIRNNNLGDAETGLVE